MLSSFHLLAPLFTLQHRHFRHVLYWTHFFYTESSPCKRPPPTLHPLHCRCNSAYPSFPPDFHHVVLRKGTKPFSYFSPFFLQHSLLFCFHSPVLIIPSLPRYCSPGPKPSASLFFSPAPSLYSARLFKFAPSWLPAYLSALPLSRMVSQSREEKKWGEEAG